MENSKVKLRNKLLFTPGPLTTAPEVKEAMLTDLGSRDQAFTGIVRDVRKQLLHLAGVSADEYACVLLQGPGTFGLEAIASSAVPRDGHLLAVINGAYGTRMANIAEVHGIRTTRLSFEENEWPDVGQVRAALAADPSITHVSVVHSETTTGIVNDIESIGQAVKQSGKIYMVDAMSSFGAVPIDFERCGIDFLVSSSNKCIESVPGFTYVICRKAALEQCRGQARTVSFDLYAQWQGLERDGQFRFTPPTHAILAFHKALELFDREGGVAARAKRYGENHRTLVEGMTAMGFKTYLDSEKQGYIITSFLYPEKDFNFADFYSKLNDQGFVIYPGKLSQADCFRIGHIGQIFPDDVKRLLAAVKEIRG
ncbi:MAG: 2-aminoethylphosphonate--pyruvate transaminase [Bacteroidales bacterium]|jgi:2-aminoethylphosphonate-pyruvate transaminase|nr:2-aminoethylphosphonate--pyruvate transaminase [Bacteroidales bacterium]